VVVSLTPASPAAGARTRGDPDRRFRAVVPDGAPPPSPARWPHEL